MDRDSRPHLWVIALVKAQDVGIEDEGVHWLVGLGCSFLGIASFPILLNGD